MLHVMDAVLKRCFANLRLCCTLSSLLLCCLLELASVSMPLDNPVVSLLGTHPDKVFCK